MTRIEAPVRGHLQETRVDRAAAIARAAAILLRTSAVRESLGRRGMERAVAAGEVVVLRRGWCVVGTDWRSATREWQHLLRVLAANASMLGNGGAFSHVSAAVLWGLPVIRDDLRRVHVTDPSSLGAVRAASVRDVARHEAPLTDDDYDVVGGVPCTSLARTVTDMLRSQSRECAIVALDAAMRLMGSGGAAAAPDNAGVDLLRTELEKRIRDMNGHRGIIQARTLLPLARPEAESPAESLSALHLHDLGFEKIRMQVPVTGPNGEQYRVDFGLDDADAWGEVDGLGKYFVGGQDSAFARRAFAAEKRREDWIRAVTGRRLVRWTWAELDSATALGAHLRSAGIRPGSSRPPSP